MINKRPKANLHSITNSTIRPISHYILGKISLNSGKTPHLFYHKGKKNAER